MSTLLLTGYTTIMELAKHEHGGALLPLINFLAQRLDILGDANWHVCNDGSSHKGNRESTRPTGTYRAFHQGIDAESPTSAPYEEPTTMLDGLHKIDAASLRQRANPGIVRARLIGQYAAGMLATFVNSIFYGDRSVDGIRINGITIRSDWNTLSSAYVYDNSGGTASLTANKASMFLIGMGEDKFSLTYPRNDAPMEVAIPDPDVVGVGVRLKDFNVIITLDGNSKEYPAYVMWLETHFGIDIANPKYVRRVANISTTNIDGVDDHAINEDYLIDAMNDMPDLDNAYWYVPRILRAQLRKRVNEKGNLFHTMDAPFGKNVPAIDGIPIRLVEELSTVEDTVA